MLNHQRLLSHCIFIVGFSLTISAADATLQTTDHPRALEAYGKLPLSFEANRGQTDSRVKFLARGPHQTTFLTATESVFVFTRSNTDGMKPERASHRNIEERRKLTQSVLRMSVVGANSQARTIGCDPLPGKTNYFIGNDPTRWRRNVPTYAKVEYQDIYSGIDLVFYGNQRALEYDFIVRPGADERRIRLRFAGANDFDIDAIGDLVLRTAAGTIRVKQPVAYQNVYGTRHEVSACYVRTGTREVRIRVHDYDATRPLVIDPTLFYSTYLGGSNLEDSFGIAVDVNGNAYVAGSTSSIDFPTTSGAFQSAFNEGSDDAYVTKLNPTGSALVYSTYLGGSALDLGAGIAVDAAGNAYVTGRTESSNFPTTPGAFQTSGGGVRNVFVTKLNPSGSGLLYSTYLGYNDDVGLGIKVDASGNAYVTGRASSGFPTTFGSFQSAPAGSYSAFVTKLNQTGTALVYSTCVGGSGSTEEQAFDIALDAVGDAFITGSTRSDQFPTTPGAFQPIFGGVQDSYVTKLNATGSALLYSTFLGGAGVERGGGIAMDAAGNVAVVGTTASTNYPTTLGAFQPNFGGGSSDVFVTKLTATGAVIYSTFLGGSGADGGGTGSEIVGVVMDPTGNAFITGQTSSTNFPVLNPIQPTLAGASDAFVTELNPTGNGLVYSTYLGGSGNDGGGRIALDSLPNPNAYVDGDTTSVDFPVTTGAFQTTYGGGGSDAFVTKIANIVLPPPPVVGKVTGGGSINVANGIGTFGFIVQRQATDATIQGDLQYVNHAIGASVHSVAFDSFAIVGNNATFGGVCVDNGAPCTFTVNVTDNGEPGTNDVFTISVSGGPTDGGTLRSGNIQIHNQ